MIDDAKGTGWWTHRLDAMPLMKNNGLSINARLIPPRSVRYVFLAHIPLQMETLHATASLGRVGPHRGAIGPLPGRGGREREGGSEALSAEDQRIVSAAHEGSRVMEHLDVLVNRIGPRLTGSDDLTNACEWTRDRFASFGIDNARLEQWGEFPVGFNRGPWFGHVVAPEPRSLEFVTMAWSAGTRGPLKAKAVLAPKDDKELDEAKAKGTLAGAWVVMPPPRPRPAGGGFGGRRQGGAGPDPSPPPRPSPPGPRPPRPSPPGLRPPRPRRRRPKSGPRRHSFASSAGSWRPPRSPASSARRRTSCS